MLRDILVHFKARPDLFFPFHQSKKICDGSVELLKRVVPLPRLNRIIFLPFLLDRVVLHLQCGYTTIPFPRLHNKSPHFLSVHISIRYRYPFSIFHPIAKILTINISVPKVRRRRGNFYFLYFSSLFPKIFSFSLCMYCIQNKCHFSIHRICLTFFIFATAIILVKNMTTRKVGFYQRIFGMEKEG